MRWLYLTGAYLAGVGTVYLFLVVRDALGFEDGLCITCGLPSWDERCGENQQRR